MSLSRRDLLLTTVLMTLGGGCTPSRVRGPVEHLDRRTGLTLRITRRPFLFGRDEPAIAIRAQDQVAIHAVEFNRSGRSDHALALLTWTTIDRLGRPTPPPAAGWILVLDDRRVPLSSALEPRAAGIADWPLPLPAPGARLSIHPCDIALLAYWADATRQLLYAETGGVAQEPYLLREDGREALVEWLSLT